MRKKVISFIELPFSPQDNNTNETVRMLNLLYYCPRKALAMGRDMLNPGSRGLVFFLLIRTPTLIKSEARCSKNLAIGYGKKRGDCKKDIFKYNF
jgi:hypothetical protein